VEPRINNSGIYQSEKKIIITLILVSIIFFGKFSGAVITNSLALFSDTWHLLTDILSLLISWWGLRMAQKTATRRYTFGYYRFSILTALINNVSLIAISIFIFYKAVLRFLHPVQVQSAGMIVFAILGLVINSLIIFNLHGKTNNVNVKSVFLHFMGDALSDLGVLFGGIIIAFTGLYGTDTLLSAILACLILFNAVKMSIECVKILLEGAPASIPIDELKNSMIGVDGVVSVTDLHVWSLSMENVVMTAHVCLNTEKIRDSELILHSIQHLLKDKYQIEHSTIQFEHCTCSSCYHSKPDHNGKCSLCIDQCRLIKQ
jgi:cobalt-zinc-cadmium efflux system protein